MLKDEIKIIIEKRKSYDEEDYINIAKSWKELTNKLCEDLNASIDFMLNECLYDEFYWISEVFEDIIYKTQSKEFLDCINKAYLKFEDIAKARGDSFDVEIEAAKNSLE